VGCIFNFNIHTGYFTNDSEPGGIENATHNTFPKLTWHEAIYRVIHERGISEFLFAATHYTLQQYLDFKF
jgi:hypothetical protein